MENIWVLFELSNQKFGIQAKDIREMVKLSKTHAIPTAPTHIRGMMELRDTVFPVLDLRKFMGMNGYLDDHQYLLSEFLQRKQDHINWLTELRASVEEDRPFKLTTDPHACAFGKWYDHYKADDPVLAMQLGRFDIPHKRIHQLGIEVTSLIAENAHDKAMAIIEKAWDNDLATMIKLFDETLPMMDDLANEIVIVAQVFDRKVAIVVDSVQEVRVLEPGEISDIDDYGKIDDHHDLIIGMGNVNEAMHVLLDSDKLFQKVMAYRKAS